MKTATADSPFTKMILPGKVLRLPIAHGEGCYFADEQTIAQLKANDQILWQYASANGEITDAANPNGSLQNIAGICNEARNVAGLMPHPERASEPLLGSADGRAIFESLIHTLESKQVAAPREETESGYRAQINRRMKAMDAGQKVTQEEFEAQHEELKSQGR